MTSVADAPTTSPAPPPKKPHPLLDVLKARLGLGVLSVFVIATIVYFATLVLPGDAATSILGSQATPERVAALRAELNLDQPALVSYGRWLAGLATGDFGTSLASRAPVWDVVEPRLLNSAVLVVLASLCSTVLGVALGAYAAARRDKVLDHTTSVLSLVASSLPEFTVGVFVVLVLAFAIPTGLPSLSILPPGTSILGDPVKLALPLITLVVVTTPYVFRMTRAATIDALISDYAEVARLKGVSERRLIFRHALPNALGPIIQVVGLNLLYLAGGIVLVEVVFQFPGIGLTLVNSVTSRDIPVLQFLVVVLSVFYVAMNLLTDLAVLAVTPRKLHPREG